MDRQAWSRIREAFAVAAEKQGEEREEILRSLPAEVEGEVRALLEADERAGVFLEQPDSWLAPGTVLDRYEIAGLVARGGMGEVYRAARRGGGDQPVAIKVLGRVFLFGEAERHFARERQILAQLSHPNIVRMLDSGQSGGWQYLVMEWVEGRSVDEWAREAPVEDRLRLFEEICGAVHAAHQSLIVHRDLKPSNILVTKEGQPKLLDFGIARLLDLAGEMPAATKTALRAMTLAYCSPEQARGLRAGIPSDIYSLGLVLYEMLTGRRAQVVESLPLDEAIRRITTEEPARAPGMRRDMDSVIRKAASKEPGRRYASALELREDVRRYRMGYPVLAQAPTLRYTAGKFVRRNRAAVACAGVCLLAALIALGAFVAQYRRAQRERAMAEKRFHAARQMAQLLMFDAPDKVAGIPGTIDARKWMAERATDYLEQLAADVQGDANLALSVAKGYRQVAFQQFNVNAANLNDPTGALGSLERGAAVLESVPNAGPETLFEMIQNRLQRPYFVLGRTKEAIENEDRAALLVERLGSMGDPRSRDLQARIWFQQAANIARPETRRLELWGKLEGYYASRLAEKPGDLERLRNLALIHKNVSGVYGFRHEWEKALAHDRMAIELDEKRREGRPEDPNILMDLSFDYGRLGQDLCGAGRSEEGVLSLRRAVSMRRPLAEREPEDKRAPERLAWMLGELGKQLLKGRGAKEGEQLVREALAIREKISAAGAGENSSPHLHQMIALVEEGRGRRREACRAWLAAARALPADTSGLIWRQVNPQEIRGRAAACGAR